MGFKSKADRIHPSNKFIPPCHYSKIHDYVVTKYSTSGTHVFLACMQCGCTKTAVRV